MKLKVKLFDRPGKLSPPTAVSSASSSRSSWPLNTSSLGSGASSSSSSSSNDVSSLVRFRRPPTDLGRPTDDNGLNTSVNHVTSNDCQKITAFIRRSKSTVFCSSQLDDFSSLCDAADTQLFTEILHNPCHVLQALITPQADHNYNLRDGPHNRQLHNCNNKANLTSKSHR